MIGTCEFVVNFREVGVEDLPFFSIRSVCGGLGASVEEVFGVWEEG